jgi:hypothetical protein
MTAILHLFRETFGQGWPRTWHCRSRFGMSRALYFVGHKRIASNDDASGAVSHVVFEYIWPIIMPDKAVALLCC